MAFGSRVCVSASVLKNGVSYEPGPMVGPGFDFFWGHCTDRRLGVGRTQFLQFSFTSVAVGLPCTMAKLVREIMNPELFSVREHEQAEDVMRYLTALGITAAPVLDAKHVPIGFVSLRDFLRHGDTSTVGEIMSFPVDVVDADATVEDAADRLIEHNRHHLPVVDAYGRAIGFVSLLDIVRALRGHPVQHPETFPHHDPVTGLTWCDPLRFDDEAVMRSPAGPGIYVLVRSIPHHRDRAVWSEASPQVRTRLRELLHTPMSAPPHLVDAIEQRQLLVRFAAAPSSRALYEKIHHRET